MKNNQLLSRLIFLAIFSLTIFGIFFFGQLMSRSEEASITGPIIEYKQGEASLVEFSDFQCPACGMYYPIVKQLREEFGDNLKVVYKHFPLQQIHQNANLAARASEAALIQDKFWEMHNIIFEKQKEWSDSSQAASLFAAYGMSLGLNADKLVDDMESSALYDKVNADYREGISLKVGGTPTFFLNGKKITNPKSYDDFRTIIQAAIAQ